MFPLHVLKVMALNFLFQYPGWSQIEDGSIRVAEVTEDSLGTYACVPYNALGTMGQSPPAPLVLKVLIYLPMAVHPFFITQAASLCHYLICVFVSFLHLHLLLPYLHPCAISQCTSFCHYLICIPESYLVIHFHPPPSLSAIIIINPCHHLICGPMLLPDWHNNSAQVSPHHPILLDLYHPCH